MRKLIYTIGAIVIATVAVFVWSHTALVAPEASTASTVGLGQGAAVAAETRASPTDIMIDYKGPALPVEQWDAH